MIVWPFQIVSKTHSDRQPVVDSPQTVGGGVLYMVMFLRPVHTDAGSLAKNSFLLQKECSCSKLLYIFTNIS